MLYPGNKWLLFDYLRQECACTNSQIYLHLNIAVPVGPNHGLFSVHVVSDSA